MAQMTREKYLESQGGKGSRPYTTASQETRPSLASYAPIRGRPLPAKYSTMPADIRKRRNGSKRKLRSAR